MFESSKNALLLNPLLGIEGSLVNFPFEEKRLIDILTLSKRGLMKRTGQIGLSISKSPSLPRGSCLKRRIQISRAAPIALVEWTSEMASSRTQKRYGLLVREESPFQPLARTQSSLI